MTILSLRVQPTPRLFQYLLSLLPPISSSSSAHAQAHGRTRYHPFLLQQLLPMAPAACAIKQMACGTPSRWSTANRSLRLHINNLIHPRRNQRSLSLFRTNQILHNRRYSHPRLHSRNKYNRGRNLAGRLLLGPVHTCPPRVRHRRLLPKSSHLSSPSMRRARHRPQAFRPRGSLARVPALCRVPKRANTSEVFRSTRWASERSLAQLLPRRLRILPPKLLVLPPRAPRQPSTRLSLKFRDRLLADPRRCKSHLHPRVARQSRLLPRRHPYSVRTTARRIVAAR